MVGNLYLANGIMLDKTEQFLYLSETMMDRVLRFRVNLETGTLSNRETYQSVMLPDNLAVDGDNNLWITSFFANQVGVIDHWCRSFHPVFHATSETREAALEEWVRRSHLGQARLELLTSDSGHPLPMSLTGLFFSPNQDTVYFTALGKAILKFKMPQD